MSRENDIIIGKDIKQNSDKTIAISPISYVIEYLKYAILSNSDIRREIDELKEKEIFPERL